MSIQHSSGSECALLRAARDSGAAQPDIYASGNRITGIDRAIISHYFSGRWSLASVTRPEKSAKLRRRWVVGGRLPATAPTASLPHQLENMLSVLSPGYARRLVGCDVLCIEVETMRIADFMHNAGPAGNHDTAHLLVACASGRPSAGASRLL